MPASEAQIRANRENSAKSTGPRSPSGKAASRANSYKHGLTGEGTVMSEREAAAERGFFRPLKELRQLVKDAKEARAACVDATMASILSKDSFEKMYADAMKRADRQLVENDDFDDFADLQARVDVPISVGERR